MAIVSLSELSRALPPFANEQQSSRADQFWYGKPASAKAKAQEELMRAFYHSRGIDTDQPMDKTIRILDLREKTRQHDEWHSAFEQFRRSL